EHSEGRRGVALLRGLRATMQQPWRPSAWKGLIALGIKPIAPLPDYRTSSSYDGAAAPGAAVSANSDWSVMLHGEAEQVQEQFPTHVDQGRRAERPVERLMAS